MPPFPGAARTLERSTPAAFRQPALVADPNQPSATASALRSLSGSVRSAQAPRAEATRRLPAIREHEIGQPAVDPDAQRSQARAVARRWQAALETTAEIARNPSRIFPGLIEDLAEQFGDSLALLSERESFTYRTLAERSNRYARWGLDQTIAKGDVVCLLMPNRPEYLAIWFGLTHIGAIVALVNTNLAGAPLAHSIDIVKPTHVIVAAELLDALGSALEHLTAKPAIWVHGEAAQRFSRIDRDIERFAGDRLRAAERREIAITDRALYIYTSGTTGLPKAANVSHYRVMAWSHWFAGMMSTEPSDRMYDCLPLYHATGGIVAIGSLLVNGGSAFIREKFSARHFWNEITAHDCTLFQYIGELCRYLVNTPPEPGELTHRLRLCCGNGARADVWTAFKSRFRIPEMLEFYAATEANFSLYNLEGQPGAIGRVPAFLAHRFPATLVKVDIAEGEPIRDDAGFCIRCAPDEVGEAIGKIVENGANLANRFEGYASEEDTERKILRDVFAKGDAWIRTGDLMRRDERGFFYFVDRVGDSFRWKGENVATCEVAEAIAGFSGIAETTVYGVTVPGTEGRAGMAAMVTDGPLDLIAFRKHLVECLPSYARPIFLRIGSAIETTATFRPKKHQLIRDGFDPAATADVIYFDDPERGAFVPLDGELFARIQAGRLRL